MSPYLLTITSKDGSVSMLSIDAESEMDALLVFSQEFSLTKDVTNVSIIKGVRMGVVTWFSADVAKS